MPAPGSFLRYSPSPALLRDPLRIGVRSLFLFPIYPGMPCIPGDPRRHKHDGSTTSLCLAVTGTTSAVRGRVYVGQPRCRDVCVTCAVSLRAGVWSVAWRCPQYAPAPWRGRHVITTRRPPRATRGPVVVRAAERRRAAAGGGEGRWRRQLQSELWGCRRVAAWGRSLYEVAGSCRLSLRPVRHRYRRRPRTSLC